MGSKLKAEIKQNKPFSRIEQEALLNIHRTSSHVMHLFQQILKQHGLTASQYNVLRILRGAGIEGLRCTEIGERMVSRDPDITRLLERLERQRLIERKRDVKDRRVIFTYIAAEGLRILQELDPVVEESAVSMLKHMSPEKLTLLIDLLEQVRYAADAEA